MKAYACILVKSPVCNSLAVPCGSDSYVVLDGRKSNYNLLQDAIDHFTRVKPNAKYVAVFKAQSLCHTGSVVATFPHNMQTVMQTAVNSGTYK